ncbi:acyl-CoA thioesterase [Helicobacter muridarum]|uniref:Acyl-CoA hydrolase n=1 Tax=Helicobacter muridarum TaxID=216 RepID=A0A099TZ08_9HELI|nr:acyl-CoA thioesterase [Helicobacter muridarum]TLD99598.1 acyl-CoA thioesterase [Helicobacter muridarum]STQ86792.1 acyl-CoA hydrolase [Helicobacter muridarum]
MDDIFDNKTLTMSVLATPAHANFNGVMHGGDLLKLLDQVAYACATRYCGVGVVTLSVDRVLFRNPIKIGNLVHFLASINYTGQTSVEVGIRVVAENIEESSVVHCNSSYFTMVAIGSNGRPTKIPQLIPITDEEKRRFEAGRARREASKNNAKINNKT